MSEVRPGFWSAKGEAEVMTAKLYHEHHFKDWREWRRPLPRPPAGLVVFPLSSKPHPRVELYAVERRARGALSALRRVVEAARAQKRLRWAVQEYHTVERPQGAPAKSDSEVGDFCLLAAEQPAVAKAVAAFVRKYGDLVRDFGRWCADTEYGGYAASGSLFARNSPLPLLGRERFLWPKPWRRWAVRIYDRFRLLGRWEPVPAPVAFYVWAALMLTALREHPEWLGSQLFLANRLASLRLLAGGDWTRRRREIRGKGPAAQNRLPIWAVGELLDYLALSAAFGEWPVPAAKVERQGAMVKCANCGVLFSTDDGRRRYCGENCARCSDAICARRYRERHPAKSARAAVATSQSEAR